MSEDMNLSINGQSQVPPGFRFHPTEEELLHYYLRKKVAFEKIDLDVIREVDLNKLEPWDIQEKCKIGSTPQNDWYFFSHKDKKYPTGTRTNRATAAGFWKATGRDKIIYSGFRRIGLRKTLVFYKGRAPHGQKSDWIMHEYRLDETTSNDSTIPNPMSGDSASSEDGWVVCRVFKKKNYQKALDSPKASPISMDSNNPIALHHHQIMPCSARNDGVLDQILHYMGRTCKLENDHSLTNTIKNSTNSLIGNHNVDLDHDHDHHHHHHHQTALNERFMHLPRLESPTLHSVPFNHHCYKSMDEILLETEHQNDVAPPNNHHHHSNNKPSSTAQLNDWVALDRLVASQLNGGQDPTMTASFCSPSPDPAAAAAADEDDAVVDAVHLSSSYNPYGLRSKLSHSANSIYVGGDADLWSSFAARSSPSPSSSDPLCHLSV